MSLTATRLTGIAIGVGYVSLLFHALRVFFVPSVLSLSSGNERVAFALCIWLVNVVTLLSFNVFFFSLYALQLPAVESRRVLQRPWPWQDKALAPAFYNLVHESLFLTFVNTTLVALPLSFFSAPLSISLQPRLFDPAAAPAFFPAVVGSLLFCAAVDDVVFYWAHRAFHHPALYWLHKPHHKWTHTVSIAVLHLHPVEFVLANVLPNALGPTLLKLHMSVILLWYHLRFVQTIEAHSNYAFQLSPFVCLGVNGAGAAHEMHHSENVGNFGSFTTWWDRIFGTAIHGRRTDEYEKAD